MNDVALTMTTIEIKALALTYYLPLHPWRRDSEDANKMVMLRTTSGSNHSDIQIHTTRTISETQSNWLGNHSSHDQFGFTLPKKHLHFSKTHHCWWEDSFRSQACRREMSRRERKRWRIRCCCWSFWSTPEQNYVC